ncbi:Prolyl 4-hydroxylase alpha-subunit N-terminal [Trinorchestia longiramus]|nr:Prolyl 4-hydroxylase alpha-subunit N-terminal [Trinorchestia longiramus]
MQVQLTPAYQMQSFSASGAVVMIFQVVLLPMLLMTKFVTPSDNVAGSTFDVEDLILAEAESVRLLDELCASLTNYTSLLGNILEAWREADYESVLPADSPSHFRTLSDKRYLLKYENGAPKPYLARIALSVRLASKEDSEKETTGHLTEKDLARRKKLKQYQRDGGGALHPIDAFLLIKRTSINYKSAVDALDNAINVFEGSMHDLKLQRASMNVSTEDLSAATEALLHLQETQHLNTSLLAAGFIPVSEDGAGGPHNFNHSAVITGHMDMWDMLQIAQAALRTARPQIARSWYESAASLLQEEQTLPQEVLQLRQQIQHVPPGDQESLNAGV